VASRTFGLIAVSLFALLLTGPIRLAAARKVETPEIGLLLRFDAPPGRAFVAAMERELARIMSSANLRLKWLFPENSESNESFAREMVFTFHGSCRAIPGEPGALEFSPRVTLADTLMDGAALLPYSEANCDRLRGFLSADDDPQEAGAESRLGFAMARVLAHEMYHVLLQTRAHGKRGIAKAAHTPSALLSGSLGFDAVDLVRLQAQFATRVGFEPN
jgi:hypothetical protein